MGKSPQNHILPAMYWLSRLIEASDSESIVPDQQQDEETVPPTDLQNGQVQKRPTALQAVLMDSLSLSSFFKEPK